MHRYVYIYIYIRSTNMRCSVFNFRLYIYVCGPLSFCCQLNSQSSGSTKDRPMFGQSTANKLEECARKDARCRIENFPKCSSKGGKVRTGLGPQKLQQHPQTGKTSNHVCGPLSFCCQLNSQSSGSTKDRPMFGQSTANKLEECARKDARCRIENFPKCSSKSA